MNYCLILDGNVEHANALAELADKYGFAALRPSSLDEARSVVAENHVVIAFIDLNYGEERSGFKLLQDDTLISIEAMCMSEFDDPALADEAVRSGASYFFCKPFDESLIGPILQDIAEELEPVLPDEQDGNHCTIDQFGFLRGSSPSMRKLYRLLRKVAQSDASLMIMGESGTGKDLVAQTAHTLSARSAGPFVAFNCAAVAESLVESELFGHEKGSFSGAHNQHRGFFERAHGGTLFLDEITEMDVGLQAKLLRVIETRMLRRLGSEKDIEIDVRFISATNRSLEEAVRNGTLREDLYYRLAQFPVKVPPLRLRGDDIAGLAQYFLNTLNGEYETDIAFSRKALDALEKRSWPGNVRELKNSVERAYIVSESIIHAESLPDIQILPNSNSEAEKDTMQITVSVGSSLEDAERELILTSLKRNKGNKKNAAAELGISLKTLYNRLQDYRHEAPDGEISP